MTAAPARPIPSPEDASAPDPYPGLDWLGGSLPLETEPWEGDERVRVHPGGHRATAAQLRQYLGGRPWVAPARDIAFLTDIHADADAFWRSLVASGGVARTGPADADFELTPRGEDTHFVLGGDYFDKGPANLPLLDAMAALRDRAEVTFLAGNHDVRTWLGIAYAESEDPETEHLFARMGRKGMTLLHEVFEQHVAGGAGRRISNAEAAERLFPSERWYETFPRIAEGLVPPKRIAKELRRVREKCEEITKRWAQLGTELRDLHAALEQCRRLFLSRTGAYAWLFRELRIGLRAGSCLFVHAGVDDTITTWIRSEGVEGLNLRFREALHASPFELYNGPLGNVFRTKYRDLDRPLTSSGVQDLHRSGIYAIVHGHRNVHDGQELVFQAGMLQLACDASVDRGTREREGLGRFGGAATCLRADASIAAISTDHPKVKVFDPGRYCGWVTAV